MLQHIFVILALLLSTNIFAQKTIVWGKISDGTTPLFAANIYVQELQNGVLSRIDGSFELEIIREGSYTIVVSMVGYQTVQQNIVLKKNQNLELNFNLEKSSFNLNEILIVDEQTGLTNLTPYSLTKIDAQNIEFKGNPSGLMGIMRENNGLHGSEMGQGIVKPFIRGLGFGRVVTIYQGNKLENQQWGADHGLGINDLGVSGVEIIKGPSSILYGSGALGGVILIKDDEYYLNANNQIIGRAGFSFNSVSNGIRPTLSLGKSYKNGLFFATEGAYESHSDYVDGNKRIIGNSRFQTQTFRFHTGINKKNFRNKLSYTYHKQSLGIIEDDEMILSSATTRNDRKMQLPLQIIGDHILSYKQNFEINKFSTSLNLSYHTNDRKEIEEAFDEIDLGLMQTHLFYNARVSHQSNALLKNTVGIQGSLLNNKNNPNSNEILIPNATFYETGLYYLANLSLNKFHLMGGVRYDNRKVIADASASHIIDYGYILPEEPENRRLSKLFSGITGSLGTSVQVSKLQLLKVNFSTGFRAPDLAELFSNGPHPGTNRFEKGNANFKREQSYQLDFNWIFENQFLKISTSIYGNLIDNYIYFNGTGEVINNELEIWEFSQTNALLYGSEFYINYSPFKNKVIQFISSANWVRGRDTENDSWLTFIPADQYFIRFQSQPFKNLNTQFFASLRYVDIQDRLGINEETTMEYKLLNAGLNHQFVINKKSLNIGITVNNILNEVYTDHISILRAFNVTHPGRNILANVTLSF